jgi:hypothetical protein
MPKWKVVPCVSSYPYAKFGEFWTLKSHCFEFESFKKSEKWQGPLASGPRWPIAT